MPIDVRVDPALPKPNRPFGSTGPDGVLAHNVFGEQSDLPWLSIERVHTAPDTSAGEHARAVVHPWILRIFMWQENAT